MIDKSLHQPIYNEQKLPPTVAGNGLLNAIKFANDPYLFLTRCRDKLGDNFTLRLPGGAPLVWSSDPAVIKASLKLKAEDFDASKAGVPFDIGEESLTFMNGVRHQAERKMIFPTIHNQGLRAFGAIMQSSCREVIDHWKVGQTVNISSAMEEMTLNVILRCVFGAQDLKTLGKFRDLIKGWTHLALSPAVAVVGMLCSPTKVRSFLDKRTLKSYHQKLFDHPLRTLVPWLRLCDARARFMHALMEEVERARAANDLDRCDLLNVFALMKTEDGNWLTDEHILSELVSILVAGHETTARTSSWALYYILRDKEVVKKIRTEIKKVFGDGSIEPDRINQLEYLAACIDESQRLAPIAVGVPRHLTKPANLAGLELPADVMFLPALYLVQNRMDIWGKDVAVFRPERMLEEKIKLQHFLPFGGGRRRCIGAAFAQNQMRLQLAEIISSIELRTDPNFIARPQQSGQAVDIKGEFKADVIRV